MKRILHLRASAGLYGADQAVLALAGATRAPFDTLVGSIVRRGNTDLLARAAKARGLRSVPLESRGKLDGHLVSEVVATVSREGVVLLHAHDYKSLLLGLAAGRQSNVPVVATFHGDTHASVSLTAYEHLAHVSANFTRGVAAVSRGLEATLRRWAPFARIVHVPNGIAPVLPIQPEERRAARQALGLGTDEFVGAVLGRLSPEKGHRVLVEAMRRIHRPPTVLVAGDGPLASALAGPARFLPMKLLGFQRDVRALYAAMDLLLLPSLTEGLPLVALEAMAHGRPVLASAVGELPTLLAEGAGRLVPPGDSDALAQVLGELREDSGQLERLARAGQTRVEASYGLDRMAQRYAEELYLPALSVDAG